MRITTNKFGTLLLLALAATTAWAQQAAVPPPPEIDDPGVAAARTVPAPVLPVRALAPTPVIPANVPVRVMPAPASTALPPEATPDVQVRREGGDTVEEYRRNGRLYMIRVVPKRGVTQTYIDSDNDGRLDGAPGTGRVAPVLYTIYEWGKPSKPAEAATSGR